MYIIHYSSSLVKKKVKGSPTFLHGSKICEKILRGDSRIEHTPSPPDSPHDCFPPYVRSTSLS